MKAKNVTELVKELLAESYLTTHSDFPFTATLAEGTVSKVLVIAGENSTGKSLIVQLARHWGFGHYEMQDSISISIRERTGSGLSEMAGMKRAMIFGNENEQSTGATSAKITERALDNLLDWASKIKTFAVLDEPDLGLSEEYAAPLGELIGSYADKLTDDKNFGIIVVTHSKALASELQKAAGGPVSFLKMGVPMTFEEWLSDSSKKSLAELKSLNETSRVQRKKVQSILAELKNT